MSTHTLDEGQTVEVSSAVCRELLRLAQLEESMAAAEAARVHYWEPCPASVQGHRVAAAALREAVARLAA
ncbi:MAG TPA: hypothetical protein VLI04_07680 [Nocardioidaceae bacterium]|nr:hypothetical protein [Nocardioidaceae bacterium]